MMKWLATVMGRVKRTGVAKLKDEGILVDAKHDNSTAYYPLRSKFMGRPKRHGRSRRSYGPGITGTLVRVCAGGRHAWFSTHCGLIRKPYGEMEKQDD